MKQDKPRKTQKTPTPGSSHNPGSKPNADNQPNSDSQVLSLSTKIAYGIGDIYGGGSFFLIGALFLVFLTDVVGLSPVLGGTILMVGKIWDAITDPLMGFVSDNTNTRFGRRRVYFLAGIIPVFFSFAFLWLTIPGTQLAQFFYYLFVYLFFNTVFTMVMVPYNSMPAEMTSSYGQRSRLIGVRMFFSQLGVLSGAVLAKTVVDQFQNPTLGYLSMGIIFGTLFSLPWIWVFLGTFEKNQHPNPQPIGNPILHIAKEFASTFRNRSLGIHISMYLAAYVTIDVFNALFLFYLKDYLGKEPLYQTLLGIVILTQISSLILVAKGCELRGNAQTYRTHLLLWGLGFLIFGFIGPRTSLIPMILAAMLIGMGMSGGAMIPFNMLAFVVDADELITRRRREGIYSGMMTFARKTAQAIALFLVGLGLDQLGYIPSTGGIRVVQGQSTVQGIRIMMMVLPGILLVFGFFISFKFHISPKNHRILMEEINRLKAGADPESMDTATAAVCRKITGRSPGELWIQP